jgi:hypothetical protein
MGAQKRRAFASRAGFAYEHGAHLRVQIAGQTAPLRQVVSGAHSSRQHVFAGAAAGGTTTMAGCGRLGNGENWASAGVAANANSTMTT